ncbi:MAG: Flp family type IVb pilin, partial [Acidobacteria bacterium]|nr:Flp family type IVb pilin [Acidobacteriota bacterium]
MSKWEQAICKLRIRIDTSGQDLVEYALLAGFVAVAAGVFFPSVTASMSTIYSRLASKLAES